MMGNAHDVIQLLLEQHAAIRTLFVDVRAAEAERRDEPFAQLRALIVVHETAEQLVLRPMSEDLIGQDLTGDRNREEREATKMLAELEKLNVDSPDFAEKLAIFEKAITFHAEAEELHEFPAVVAGCTETQRAAMGRRLKATEAVAPTRPHPAVTGRIATLATAPIASIVDRTRDAIKRAR